MALGLGDIVRQSFTSIWTIIPIFLILTPCIYILYIRFFHPLASIPGPFSAAISRLWMAKHSWDGDMQFTMIEMHNKYGSLVRTAPNEISVNDPAAVKKIYASASKFPKSDWYSVWQGHRKFDVFPERSEKIHGQQRRLVSRPYSMDALKDLEPYVNEALEVFFKNIDERARESLDLGKWFHLFSFDVIGEITFSKRFGFMDAGSDDGSIQQIETAMRSAAWLGQVPSVYWLHDRLMPYIGNHLGITARHGSLRQFAIREIAARKDRGTDHQDMLSKLFAIQKEKPEEMNETAVTSMATSNIFAGSDSTAISLRAIVYYLLKNPETKKKLVEEIDERRRQGKLSDPVTLSEANDMPYLQAVMYEGTRLHPAVGMTMPRVVPEGGLEACGQYLPAGTVVGANAWVVHRNKDIYGADADEFRPERWLVDDVGDLHRFYLSFGAGARVCLGRNISWMEMSKLIPTLFMRYDVVLTDPEAEWTMKAWWFVTQKGLNVRLRARREMS